MKTSTSQHKSNRASKATRAFVAVLAVLLCLSCLWPLLGAAADGQAEQMLILIDDGKVAPGVKIAGVEVGGQTPEEAQVAIAPTTQEMLNATTMTIQYPDYTDVVPVANFGVQADMATALKSMMGVGRGGNMQQRLDQRAAAAQGQIDLPMGYSYDEAVVREKAKLYLDSISREPVSETANFDPSLPERFTFTEGHMGFQPEEQPFIENIVAAIQTGALSGVQAVGSSVSGDVPVEKDVREHTKLVAKYTTKVKKNPARTHNIILATERINGKIVQPGETFSCNDTIGPRTDPNVWKKAPAIQNRVSVMELGGGVCQVSSTLFNAVARADAEMVQWVHHSIPSDYVTIGCDATISTGGPDFKFKNNSDWPMYLVGYYDEEKQELTFEVWGDPLPDGMSIDIVGEQIGTVPAPAGVQYVSDPKLVSKARNGKKSQTTKIWYDANGKEIKREIINKNTYPAVAARVLAGSQPSKTQKPTTQPTQKPTQAPTQAPTQTPTQAPTQPPTQQPSDAE